MGALPISGRLSSRALYQTRAWLVRGKIQRTFTWSLQDLYNFPRRLPDAENKDEILGDLLEITKRITRHR
jgi:hypothetical protein